MPNGLDSPLDLFSCPGMFHVKQLESPISERTGMFHVKQLESPTLDGTGMFHVKQPEHSVGF